MTQNNISSKWSDLAPRVLSAIAMAVIAVVAISVGGAVYVAMIAVVIGLCMWEFSRLISPDQRDIHYLLAALSALAIILVSHGFDASDRSAALATPKVAALFVAPIIGAVLLGAHRVLFFTYASLILLAGLGFVAMGPGQILIWFVLIIIMSDVAGYFAGRTIGGPKFWPRVSPKKTWSGTIAGWVGALLLGLIAVTQGVFTPVEALFAPIIAFAGQMGDIAESAIKRKVGVKDSSNLIPGHGGVLDRFDAMIGASGALVVMVAIATMLFSGG